MSDIFISYAKEDRKRVSVLASALEEEGWSTWWDINIPAGSTFDEVIEEAITSTKCVVVVWSEHSVGSRWVKTEASEGLRASRLVPVRFDGSLIPLAFRRIQAADLRHWRGDRTRPEWARFAQAVAAAIGYHPARESASVAGPITPPIDADQGTTVDVPLDEETELEPATAETDELSDTITPVPETTQAPAPPEEALQPRAPPPTGVSHRPRPRIGKRTLFGILGGVAVAAIALIIVLTGGDDSPEPTTGPGSGVGAIPSLVCTPELQAVCEAAAGSSDAITFRVEAIDVTVDRLGAGASEQGIAGAWLTFWPWLDIVNASRDRQGLPNIEETDPVVVAESELIWVVRDDRAQVLETACGGTITWKCIGDNAATSWEALGGESNWGVLKPGHGSADTAAGLLAIEQILADYFDTFNYTAADCDIDCRLWFRELEDSIPDHSPAAGTPLDQLLLIPTYDVVSEMAAVANPKLAASVRDDLTVLSSSPRVTAEVVLVQLDGESIPPDLQSLITQALREAAWDPPSAQRNHATPEALDAYRQMWKETVQ